MRPMSAAHDFTIMFDGEAFGRKAELFDERADCGLLCCFARFAVDDDSQDFPSVFLALLNDAAQLRFVTV